ncbi:hypothetical protein U1Q18_046373 [Sarracenia purpurea var. burkii]
MRSSHRKFNVAVDGGEVEWRQWDAHFGDFYKTLKGITKYHHFHFLKDQILVKEFVNSESESFHLKLQECPTDLPPLIIPSGLSLQRQWYLYENIRTLCTDSSKKNVVAPKPKEPKEKNNAAEKLETASKTKKKAVAGSGDRETKGCLTGMLLACGVDKYPGEWSRCGGWFGDTFSPVEFGGAEIILLEFQLNLRPRVVSGADQRLGARSLFHAFTPFESRSLAGFPGVCGVATQVGSVVPAGNASGWSKTCHYTTDELVQSNLLDRLEDGDELSLMRMIINHHYSIVHVFLNFSELRNPRLRLRWASAHVLYGSAQWACSESSDSHRARYPPEKLRHRHATPTTPIIGSGECRCTRQKLQGSPAAGKTRQPKIGSAGQSLSFTPGPR